MNTDDRGDAPLTLPMGPFPPMAEEARAAHLAETLAATPGGGAAGTGLPILP